MNKKKEVSNLKYLALFCIVFLVLIVGALIYKGILLVQNSQFTSHSFTVLVLGDPTQIVHVNREVNKTSLVSIKKQDKKLFPQDRVGNSIALEVPIQAVVSCKDTTCNFFHGKFLSFSSLLDMIMRNSSYSFHNLNILDVLKMYLASKSSDPSDVHIQEEETIDTLLKSMSSKKNVADFFKDEDIINEKISIEIVNAAAINGLGNRVRRMLEAVGYNVIVISNGKEQETSQIISRIEPAYTVSLLSDIFDFPVHTQHETSVADVTIVLGKDSGKKLQLE